MIENYIIDSAVDEDEFNSVEEDELDKEKGSDENEAE